MLYSWTVSEWESQRFLFEVLEVFSHHSGGFSISVLQFLLHVSGESAIRMKSNSSSECKPFLAFCCHKENLTELSPTPEPHPYNRHVTSNPASCINSRDIRCLPAFSQEASGERRNKSQAFRPWARPSVWSPTLLLFWTFQFKSKNIMAIMPPRMLAL